MAAPSVYVPPSAVSTGVGGGAPTYPAFNSAVGRNVGFGKVICGVVGVLGLWSVVRVL